jgi:hypothetical protein
MAGPASTNNAPPMPEGRAERPFATVLRGYERRQVDDYVARQRDQTATLRAQLVETQRQRRLATDHAEATEQENRRLHATAGHEAPPPQEGFGLRAEKLLRLAEHEAAEVRARSSQESVALLERTRGETETHRHAVEQSLIVRAAQLDQVAGRRAAELHEREQQIAAQRDATRADIAQLHAAATRAADRLCRESEATADEVRIRAESAAKNAREHAEHDLTRLSALRGNVYDRLSRLADVLINELPPKT